MKHWAGMKNCQEETDLTRHPKIQEGQAAAHPNFVKPGPPQREADAHPQREPDGYP